LRETLVDQAALLAELPATTRAQAEFDRALAELERADAIDALVAAERKAALAYWGAWAHRSPLERR